MRTRLFRGISLMLLFMAGTMFWSSCRGGKTHPDQDLRKAMKQKTLTVDAAPAQDAGIRSVDFKNHTFSVDGDSYPFQNGTWAEDDEAAAQINNVIYGNLMDNGREQAVVVLSGNWGGGNLVSGSVQVFDFHDGQAWEVFSTAGDNAAVKSNLLHVSYAEWAEDDALCCPTLMITDMYRWNGLTFIKEKSETSGLGAAPAE